MLTILAILVVLGVGIYLFNRKATSAPAPVLKTTKKIEEVVVKAADVNHDGKVDLKDAVAAVKAVEDTTKVVVNKAKKITSKKKTK